MCIRTEPTVNLAKRADRLRPLAARDARLMVFLIQRSPNKDALAIHLKLNELVAAIEGASTV